MSTVNRVLPQELAERTEEPKKRPLDPMLLLLFALSGNIDTLSECSNEDIKRFGTFKLRNKALQDDVTFKTAQMDRKMISDQDVMDINDVLIDLKQVNSDLAKVTNDVQTFGVAIESKPDGVKASMQEEERLLAAYAREINKGQ